MNRAAPIPARVLVRGLAGGGLAVGLPALVWIAVGAVLVPIAAYLALALALASLGLVLALRIARLRCPGCSD